MMFDIFPFFCDIKEECDFYLSTSQIITPLEELQARNTTHTQQRPTAKHINLTKTLFIEAVFVNYSEL